TSIGNDAVGGDIPVPGPDHLGGIESELEPSLARPEPGFGDLDVIDIGAGAEPSLDRAVRPHEGHRAAERPAPAAGMVAEAVLDLAGLAGGEGMPPAPPCLRTVVGMKRVRPALALGRAAGSAGELVPAVVEEVVGAVRER